MIGGKYVKRKQLKYNLMNVGNDEFLNVFKITAIIQKTTQYFNIHLFLVVFNIIVQFM